MTTYRFVEISGNKKTGPIPVVTSERSTCPDVCPLKDGGGCYGEYGNLRMWWFMLDDAEAGIDTDRLAGRIRGLKIGSLWRYAQAGDLPGHNNAIDVEELDIIVKANRGRKGFTFSHKPLTATNRNAIEDANRRGFTINVSTNNLKHADSVIDSGIAAPVVTILPSTFADKSFVTPKGRRGIVCPAVYQDTNCDRCGICQHNGENRKIVGFPGHGTAQKRVDILVDSFAV